jgi:hypothetical protein
MNPFSFHVSGSSRPVDTPNPDINSAAAASLQAPASARKQVLLGRIEEEIDDIELRAKSSWDGSSDFRDRTLAEAAELRGVQAAIASLADDAVLITLPSGLGESVRCAVETAAAGIAGLQVSYDGHDGSAPGRSPDTSLRAVVA